MSCLQNEIILENLYEEGLYEAEKQGLKGQEAEAFAEEYARSIFEEKAWKYIIKLCTLIMK